MKMDELIDRRIYKIKSRNMKVGVWSEAKKGFIGVRMKFGSRYLFTEIHWDADPRFGTAVALEDLGINVPDTVAMQEGEGNICEFCGKKLYAVPGVVTRNGKEVEIPCAYDSHVEKPTECEGEGTHCGIYLGNRDLFALLDPWDRKFYEELLEH